MALTPSTMLPLGTSAPGFELPEPATGRIVRLGDFSEAPALVVAFLCNHCPYVKHLRAALAQFGRECASRGVAMVGINSNDVTNYPADAPERMAEEVRSAGWTFPYLYDASQAIARAYHAACTPDFFLFDRHRLLVYRGQFDDSRPGNGKAITGTDLRTACNIKWKPGQEPEYFQARA